MRKAAPVLTALVFVFALALTSTPVCSAQSQLVGEWRGSISINGQSERILWHVVKAADGSVSSTYDNVDEGVTGIKVKSLTVKGAALTAAVDDVIHVNGQNVHVAGTYAGTISSDGNQIAGTWTQTAPPQPPADIHFKREQAASAAAVSPQIAGDWHGTLSAAGSELRLVFHFTAGSGGALSGTLDSIDQGANGIPISSVTLKDAKLSLTLDAVRGTYEGSINPDATQIKGTWSQGMPLELNLERGALQVAEAKPAAPTDIDGTWEGMLDTGSVKLRLDYKIENTEQGLTAKLQSPDQSPAWSSAYPMTRNGVNVTMPNKANGSTYEGKLSGDLSSIDGTFHQAGQSLQLTLRRVKE